MHIIIKKIVFNEINYFKRNKISRISSSTVVLFLYVPSKKNSITSSIVEQFGRNAEKYVSSETHSKGPDLQKLKEWLNPGNEWKVLDIATGGGHVARTLAPHVKMVVASDITPEMLVASRKHHRSEGLGNIVYILADAESLPFPEGEFDAVTCRIAPHHFEDKAAFVREAARVLRKGGSFLLVDNTAPEDPDLQSFMNTFERLRDHTHVECATIAQWTNMIRDAGLTVEKTDTRKKRFDYPSWVQRTASGDSAIKTGEFLLSATSAQKEYFAITQSGREISSLQIDETMVLAGKP